MTTFRNLFTCRKWQGWRRWRRQRTRTTGTRRSEHRQHMLGSEQNNLNNNSYAGLA